MRTVYFRFSCSVESSDIDLSEFQEENRDNDDSGGDNPDSSRDADGQDGNTTEQRAAGTNGEVLLNYFALNLSWRDLYYLHWVKYLVENAEDGSIPPQRKKLVISDEYFQRVTQALVMRLRQHEETVAQEGDH